MNFARSLTKLLVRYTLGVENFVLSVQKRESVFNFLPKQFFITNNTAMASNYVIYDCDTGIDDAWGLLLLLKGETHTKSGPNQNGYKVLAVTTVHGNTDVDNATKNTLRLLESADRSDVPVHKGCANPILPRTWLNNEHFHGIDGFGDLKYDKEVDLSLIQKQHAVNAMYDYVCKYPHMVDFILVGPLTNFATCITMHGDDFLSKVRKIYIMGGNYRGKGNITKSAEYNFMCDPEAAHIVLENAKLPIVIVPWETCIDGEFGTTLDWRLNVLGAVKNNRAIDLLNRIERAVFVPKGFVKWMLCDAILVSTYVFPTLAIARSRLYHATVELTGTHTRGQMVLDHLKQKNDNANVVMEVNPDYYRNVIAWTAGVEGVNIKM